jgi:hypothetical protein
MLRKEKGSWHLVKLWFKIQKRSVVKTNEDVDEFLVVTIEMEKNHGEIGKIPFQPLKKYFFKGNFWGKSLIEAKSML